ncbi:hypothetical protein LE190_17050 [Massilia oculi]|uniref:Uncharacterized protein n=1 Tax=Massilia hydrophila TaxID=3044279 RepID=A0ABS7YD33_9BURK|nr:hypothetical protein [Massilia oculi]MCA1857624.1 hypothetical protein [Massilia oculi]
MQHTLVAVFDNRTDAQNAMNELMSSGFSRDAVRLSNADPTGMTDSTTGRSDTLGERDSDGTLADGTGLGIGASIKHFFTDLFGADNSPQASKYEGAVTRGHHVLTVRADSLPEVERAADIVERYGPTDIDEQASGSGAMAGTMAPGMSESMRMSGAGGMQQSASMAAQSGSGSSLGAGSAGSTGTSTGMSGSGGSATAGAAAGMGAAAAAGASRQLDNPGDRKLFQQQSLNQAEPMGTTYQEPQGSSGLGATGGTSLQGSTLRENTVQASSLDGTQGSSLQGSSLEGSALQGASGSMQRDTAMGGGAGGASSLTESQRGRSRIYSRGGDTGSGGRSLDIGSNLGGDDDDDYRNHFLANYQDEDYERIKPAYAYGSEMARSDKYRGRRWDEVENDLRSDWDTRYGGSAGTSTTAGTASAAGAAIGSTWEKMKSAVRRGWDRMTLDDDDDSYYRSHYDTHLSSSGMDYDSVKPAYTYGTDMRKSELYRNRPWDDIEGDMRRGWDSRISAGTGTGTGTSTTSGAGAAAGGAWDRMKAAVRHGWDRMTEDDDSAYRSHWNATYSTAQDAGSYDDYKPAYAYGTEMARNERYRGRRWDEVENDLRSDWDTRYGGGQSTWEKMKSAVRQGWDRVTS